MLTMKTFNEGFKRLQLCFEFSPDQDYQSMVYNALKDKLIDVRFIKSCNNILLGTSKEDWNNAYGFKGRPAIKDWLDAFVPKHIEKTRYKKCEITGANQVEHYLDFPDDYLQELKQIQESKIGIENKVNKKAIKYEAK